MIQITTTRWRILEAWIFSFAAALFFASTTLFAAPPDLAKYRSGAADPRVARVSAQVQQGIFVEPEKYLDPLVAELTSGERDPFLRVKVIHDWIAEHIAYDAKSYLSGARVDSAWGATLRRRRSVCQGYSALMKAMCERAGVPCEQVPGYGRGFGFAAAGAEAAAVENHAWNAVRIGEAWYLVDVTWDAGTVAADGFKKEFGHAYLFLRPSEFLYTHFPTDPKWQLVERPLSKEEFTRLPNLKGRFFAHGLRLQSRVGSQIAANASLKLSLSVPKEVVVSAKLRDAAGQPAAAQDLARQTLLQRSGAECSVLVLFPQAGSHQLEIFCKRRSEPEPLLLAATFAIEAAESTARIFPQTFSVYHELPACLYQPLLLPLVDNESESFRIRVPTAESVLLAVGRKPWIALMRDAKDRELFSAQVSIAGEQTLKLMIRRPGDGRQVPTLVDFSVP